MGPLLALALLARPPSPPPAERVLLVSLDGVPARELRDPRNDLPNLRALAARGVEGAVRTVLPSVTWTAHTSVVTGTLPVRHGVVGNHWIDRATGREVHAWKATKEASVSVPTLYDVAHAAGLKTAALLWPQTSGAPALDLSIPELYDEGDFKRFVTPSLRSDLVAAGIAVDRLAALSEWEDTPLDDLAADITEHVIRRHAPRLLLVHFTSADTRGHTAGPASGRYRDGLAAYDRYVGRLLAVLKDTGQLSGTAILVTSDHGFFATSRQVDAAKLLGRAGLQRARVAKNGHLAWIYIEQGEAYAENVARAADALRGHAAVERVVLPEGFAALGLPRPEAEPRAGDLLALTRTDHYFGAVAGDALDGPSAKKGTHGYLPDPPENQALFVAAGPGIARRSQVHALRLVDLAPTALHLLGLAFSTPIDGRVIREILAR